MSKYICIVIFLFSTLAAHSQRFTPISEGWANNSVNVTAFRKNSIITHGQHQFAAYYDNDGFVVLAKRKLSDKKWEIRKTEYTGNVKDAHNSISIMVDGDGYLHMSWDHHDHPLRYVRGIAPLSLTLGKKEPMTGLNEEKVCYPEFYRMPDGNLLFMYREGSSGRGNLVMNSYNTKTKKWTQIQNNLISGEDKRNAYWQAIVDEGGTIHISWVWRESWLVESNNDMGYARSADGGKIWTDSEGNIYQLPITKQSAEYAARIPQNSELINQTSMAVDSQGRPYIASYWRESDSDIPQYHIVYHTGRAWNTLNLNFRQTPFSLKGGGTKRIPIARPQLVVAGKKERISLYLIFRDEERGSKASVAVCADVNKASWKITDLTTFSVGSWEPTFDSELWRRKKNLHLFVQHVEQIDGEGSTSILPQMVQILELDKLELEKLKN